jgi:hypothetical protein
MTLAALRRQLPAAFFHRWDQKQRHRRHQQTGGLTLLGACWVSFRVSSAGTRKGAVSRCVGFTPTRTLLLFRAATFSPTTTLFSPTYATFLTRTISLLGLAARPAPRPLSAHLAAIATPRTTRSKRTSAPRQQTHSGTRTTDGSLCSQASRIMIKGAQGRFRSRKVKSRIGATTSIRGDFFPGRFLHAAAHRPFQANYPPLPTLCLAKSEGHRPQATYSGQPCQIGRNLVAADTVGVVPRFPNESAGGS